MKNFALLILLCLFSILEISAQNLDGAYISQDGKNIHLLLIKNGYISHSTYTNDSYINTRGGTYKYENQQLVVLCEFDNQQPKNVGQTFQFVTQNSKTGLEIDGLTFKKQPQNDQALDGLWRISGRMNNGDMSTIKRADRKTIKILVDGYFQWIAINPKEKGFYGTGGGSYTFEKGKYNENITFFSRDNSRVGATLTFDGKLENGDWHHSGKSSKGDPIYEIWSRE